jgi:hypothetical protein
VKLPLSFPIEVDGKRISEVTVRVPPGRAFKRRPRRISRELWSLALIAGLTVDEAAELEPSDMAAIAHAFEMLASQMKAAAHAVIAARMNP